MERGSCDVETFVLALIEHRSIRKSAHRGNCTGSGVSARHSTFRNGGKTTLSACSRNQSGLTGCSRLPKPESYSAYTGNMRRSSKSYPPTWEGELVLAC